MKIDSIIYVNEVVENTERKFGSALEYYPVYIKNADGDYVPAMFTLNELEIAIKRAANNPEDTPRKSGWWIF
jgi:hypothetical protein